MRRCFHLDKKPNPITESMFKLIDNATAILITSIKEDTKILLPSRMNTRTDHISDNSDTDSEDESESSSDDCVVVQLHLVN